MKCLKCGCEKFILESMVFAKEKYTIYINGKRAVRPFSKEEDNELRAEFDNTVKCTNCNTEYVIFEKDRDDLLNNTDFSKVDLETEAEIIERY
jgi:predicted  nucleic acid-binding Zn-ribbon protein